MQGDSASNGRYFVTPRLKSMKTSARLSTKASKEDGDWEGQMNPGTRQMYSTLNCNWEQKPSKLRVFKITNAKQAKLSSSSPKARENKKVIKLPEKLKSPYRLKILGDLSVDASNFNDYYNKKKGVSKIEIMRTVSKVEFKEKPLSNRIEKRELKPSLPPPIVSKIEACESSYVTSTSSESLKADENYEIERMRRVLQQKALEMQKRNSTRRNTMLLKRFSAFESGDNTPRIKKSRELYWIKRIQLINSQNDIYQSDKLNIGYYSKKKVELNNDILGKKIGEDYS